MLNRLRALLPRDHATTITGLSEDINDAISAFIRGQGTICLFLGLLYAAGLSLVGLRYGLVVIPPPSAYWLMPYTFGTITQS